MNTPLYAPVLKLKFGEVTAMASLSDSRKSNILPIFEVVFSGPKKDAKNKGRDARLASIINKFRAEKLPELPDWLNQARGNLPYVLDFTLIFVEEVKAEALQFLLGKCAINQHRAVVSVNLSDTKEYKDLAYSLVRKYEFELCIRVSRAELDSTTTLDALLVKTAKESGISISDIYLLVDIKEEQDDQKYTQYFDVVQALPSLRQWKNLIFTNGSFPESMGGLKSGKEHDISRTDWIRYNAAISKDNLRRKPVFSDYSARYPIYDVESEKHSPSPTIKYTTTSNWRIMKGGDYDYGNYFIYSRALIDMGPYYGEDHCAGDKFIKEKAERFHDYIIKRAAAGGKIKADKVGSSEDWIAMSVGHHTAVTLDQLSS